jgi:hypothetical protein
MIYNKNFSAAAAHRCICASFHCSIILAQPALSNPFVLIVDNWNWREARLGTFGGLLDANCRIEASIEVKPLITAIRESLERRAIGTTDTLSASLGNRISDGI